MKKYDQNWQNVTWIRLFFGKMVQSQHKNSSECLSEGFLDMKTSWDGRFSEIDSDSLLLGYGDYLAFLGGDTRYEFPA